MDPDAIDRTVFIAHSGQPHSAPIAHLSATHSLPGTANYLLESVAKGAKDPDTAKMLIAIRDHRDADPQSPTFACYKWYVEDTSICDTNASFFVCTPLAALWLAHGDELTEDESRELQAVFGAVIPWFRKMAESPSLFYPNKCVSDAAMLLMTGYVVGDSRVVEAGRDFCNRYLDYYFRRGTGWGEDHSPVYTMVIVEMTLLIMALEKSGELFDKAKRMTDAIMEWVAFHDGIDAVPSIRGYNFDCKIDIEYALAPLIDGGDTSDMRAAMKIFASISGYTFHSSSLSTPRQRQWRTFDDHYSVSYIGEHARLGTLSHYPLMPNGYMHDDWGLGWQTKPCSFIVDREEYGVLEWMTEDDEGVIRQHEANGSFQDWPSRHLFKRVSFHPEVITATHQEERAAVIFREIHNLHSPTRRIVDRWRLAHGGGRILIDGDEWDGQIQEVSPQWIVLQYPNAAVALRPLKCRVLDREVEDENPQRRMTGSIVDVSLRIERTDRGIHLSLPIVDGHAGTITQRLLFSGWCVVLMDRPEDVEKLSITETFDQDGEIPRTYGEAIRAVDLTTPDVKLKLVRDMLTGETKRCVNEEPWRFH